MVEWLLLLHGVAIGVIGVALWLTNNAISQLDDRMRKYEMIFDRPTVTMATPDQ